MNRAKQITAAVAAAVTVALIGGVAVAGQVRFNPSIALEAGTADNVEYAGATETSDTTVSLSAELPVERTWDGGSLSLRYRPSYVTHADVDALDRGEHRLDLRSSVALGRLTQMSAAIGWFKRQEQGGTRFDEADSFEERDPFLTDRSDRESSWASLSLAREQAPRWRWNAGLGWATSGHKAIDGFGVDPFDPNDPNRVEDRDELGGSFGVSRVVSRRTTVGIELSHREYELQLSGDEQADLIGLTLDHQASRRLSFSLSLGVAQQSFDDPLRSDQNDAQGAISLSRTFRAIALVFAASHRPGSGGHLAGSSTNTRTSLKLGNATDRTWGWNASLRFDRREPTDTTVITREVIVLGAGTERSFGPTFGLGLGVEWIDQSSAAGGSARSATRVSAGLRWYPRGRAVTARGGDS